MALLLFLLEHLLLLLLALRLHCKHFGQLLAHHVLQSILLLQALIELLLSLEALFAVLVLVKERSDLS